IWKSFGWDTLEIKDGHNLDEIKKIMDEVTNLKSNKPKMIIANTIKGKGISFIEGDREWHHKTPTEEEYHKCMEELK
ncbi:MAG: transketolase, partial [Nanoarchaeota archaeon]